MAQIVLDPDTKYPMVMPDGTVIKQVVNLKCVIDHPNIIAGDFSYYHNFEILDDYAAYLAPYLFPVNPEKLIIGKFCQLAHGVRFITSSVNHYMQGFSTYPFQNFMMTPDTSIEDIMSMFEQAKLKGDTVIGNDVWIGMNSLIMPGVNIGNGAIIGAGSIVTRNVPAYAIVGGNPAAEIRHRFNNEIIQALEEICWWNWPPAVISANTEIIIGTDIEKLYQIRETL